MLNVSQRLAVASTEPRLLCLAAPGSGKTRVLTERAARILATHHPKEVLLLTFTRKAAGEMRERLETAVPGKSARWWMDMQVSTMHSWGLRILRIFHDRLGMVQNFTVRDDVDREDVVRFAGLELGVMPRPGQKPKAGQVTSFKGLWARDNVRARYHSLLREAQAVDYDMIEALLLDLLRLSKDDPHGPCTWVRERWRHILVDEGQDTSAKQQEILDVIRAHNLFVVGDASQSVYGFRGANMRGFLDLGARPGWTTVTLPTNYRSHAAIVAAATACGQAMESPGLVQDAGRTEGLPVDEEDAPLDVLPAVHLDEIGGIVAADILHAREVRGLAWRDFAVLSPTWAHLEEVVGPALQAAGIPFKVARRGQTLWDTPGARWLVNTLRAAHNPDDHLSLYAALTAFSPRVTLEDWARLRAEAAASGTQVLDRFLVWPDAPRNLRNALAMVKSDERWVDGAVDAATFLVVDAELLHLRTRVEEVRAAVDALREWAAVDASVDGECYLGAFLDWYAERTVAEIEEEAEEQDEVTLLSCHGGKGLEWRSVHVVGCNEGILPRAQAPGPGLEEERRLFYVALTRGMDRVRLCFTTDRAPSRFIDEALPLWDPVSIYSSMEAPRDP